MNPSTPVRRRTSVYQVDLPGASRWDLEAALRRVPARVEVAGSGLNQGSAFVRLRVVNDAMAASVAMRMSPEGALTIRTGYGVNQREVLHRPPAGCRCLEFVDPETACPSCTCSRCGEKGRFGISIVHKSPCV